VTVSCEHGNECSGSVKGGDVLKDSPHCGRSVVLVWVRLGWIRFVGMDGLIGSFVL
jgi:hypothetical protein